MKIDYSNPQAIRNEYNRLNNHTNNLRIAAAVLSIMSVALVVLAVGAVFAATLYPPIMFAAIALGVAGVIFCVAAIACKIAQERFRNKASCFA